MNPLPALSTTAATTCLGISVWLLVTNGSQLSLESELEASQRDMAGIRQDIQNQQELLRLQQQQIDTATKLAQEIGPAVVRDLGAKVLEKNNPRIRELLAKHGITVNADPVEPETPSEADPEE